MTNLSLADILTFPVTTVAPECSVQRALALMRERRISSIIVVSGERPIGILTERDAVTLAYRHRDPEATLVADVIGDSLLTALPGMDYRQGYRLIIEHQVRHLVVVDERGGLAGVVTEGDFLSHLGSEFLVRFKEVGALMTHNVITLGESATVDDAIRLMARDRISCVVVEDQGQPVGIFTERDLVRLDSKLEVSGTLALGQVMNRPVRTVAADLALPEAMRVMNESGIRRLVVVDGKGSIVGLVTRHDVVKQLYDRHVEHLRETLEEREQELAEVRAELRVKRELQRTEERLRLAASVFENTIEGVMITDAEGLIVDVNRAFSEITGYSKQEVCGYSPKRLQSGRHGPEFYQDLWQALGDTGQWSGEIWNRHKNGSVFPEWQNISSVLDDNGRLTHYVSVFTDISHIKRAQQELDHLAHHDPLTGLPNRMLLNERLDQSIKQARRHGTQLAVVFVDLDGFKHINDSLGHPVGDKLLQAVAGNLVDTVRQGDTVARIGGDEFVLLLEDVDTPENIGAVVQKLVDCAAVPLLLDNHEISVTASLGICIYPRDGDDPATLLRNADAAMYRAKERGRNNYQFYTEQLTHNALERVVLENSLRQAIEREELHLVYQPQVDFDSGRMIGLETLIRWEHPELGLVSPARFIPLAEESGLIHPIGHWVLQTACRQGAAWLNRGLEFGHIAVNISPAQLQRGALLADVRRVLEHTGFPADRLELEVTEGFIMQQAESAIEQLMALRELGVTLSIDDFGTGYSSLSYLKQLPIQKLKIDQSFVRNIPGDPNDMAISDAIIAMGRSLQIAVIAEGVETEAQAGFLRNVGCQAGQGYLYSRPVGPDELEQLLTEGRLSRAGALRRGAKTGDWSASYPGN